MSGTPIRLSAEPQALEPTRAERIAELRSRMADMGAHAPQRVLPDADVLGVGDQFHRVLPDGGVPRRAVTHISDTPALVVEIIDCVTAEGGFAAVVGWPELSYAGVATLERVIAVPEPGIDPLAVAGVLVEGLDLVVLHTPQPLNLSPVRARPLLARVRKGKAALLTVNARVPSPALSITGTLAGFHGIGRGAGRIVGMDMRVEAAGRRTASTVITLGQAPRPAGVRAVR
ncbi:hypothetical protein RIU96_04505 [Corynebacterium sp. Z-1]|uniref:hypothetical protein n=1 Tax=Corynebacterium sp. Z-1 TaxID=3074378 RepID=UPI002883300C|nr:hypothetical protein [Corynebacterium sp. Z-1]WNI13689.1 hypothetical protein RIU96_04505 [Corynebacterium sp. Z-1]